MRVENIKVSLEIPIPVGKPDKNGVVYTKKAIEDACKNASNLPIIMYESDDSKSVFGVAQEVSYKEGFILVDGVMWHGGTEETVVFDGDKIVSMEIVGFGISK